MRAGGIYQETDPQVEKSIHKGGKSTMDEMDVLVPNLIGAGF